MSSIVGSTKPTNRQNGNTTRETDSAQKKWETVQKVISTNKRKNYLVPGTIHLGLTSPPSIPLRANSAAISPMRVRVATEAEAM